MSGQSQGLSPSIALQSPPASSCVPFILFALQTFNQHQPRGSRPLSLEVHHAASAFQVTLVSGCHKSNPGPETAPMKRNTQARLSVPLLSPWWFPIPSSILSKVWPLTTSAASSLSHLLSPAILDMFQLRGRRVQWLRVWALGPGCLLSKPSPTTH